MATPLPQPRPPAFPNALAALRAHYLLYLAEAAELAAFMLAACLVTVLLFHTGSTIDPTLARALMGCAMGLTAVAIIKSPPGKASGAQFNPAITLTFYRLGKIGPYDAIFYVLFQFLGGLAGVGLAAMLAPPARLADPQVRYAVTVPGLGGPAAAFAAETFMAALLLGVVLYTSTRPKLAPYTTYCVGVLIANYVFWLAPVSGLSINPARTVASAVFANVWTSVWVYFAAPLLGMMGVAEIFVRAMRWHAHPYFRHRHLTTRAGGQV